MKFDLDGMFEKSFYEITFLKHFFGVFPGLLKKKNREKPKILKPICAKKLYFVQILVNTYFCTAHIFFINIFLLSI